MRNKLVTILLVFAFLSVSTVTFVSFTTGDVQGESSKFDIKPLKDARYTEILNLEGAEFKPPNSPWIYPVIDDYYGALDWVPFENIFNGTFGNIWVYVDPEYDEYIDLGPEGYSPEDIWLFGYPWTPEGIPGYLPEEYRDAITGQDLLEILEQFDNNIHPTDIQYFGNYIDDPAVRPGPYDDGTVQIMIFNLRDEWFYDPDNAQGFIAGYFWSDIAEYFSTNAFHMDTYQWWRRQGETPPMIDPYTGHDYAADGISVLPWQYEGTFAHEFQHLIHHDRDPDEFSWVNEGCSDLAEWLCDYGFPAGHIEEFLLWFWDTPLTIWEGYLADYGASFLFAFYMYEHYGGAALLWDLVQDQANGIAGWANALVANGVHRSFDQIFQDWCIANYLDDVTFCKGRYGYFELDIPSDNSNGMSIQLSMELWDSWYPDTGYFEWFVDKYPHDGSYILVGRGLPYTASYVKFTKTPKLFVVEFDGDDYSGAAPTSGSHNWYSDGIAWSWFTLSQSFDIPADGATLQFSNYFSIEADWDYGYVEVYVPDKGWTTLPGLGTTTHYAYWQNNTNTPDEREPFFYNETKTWNAFTGESGGVYTEVMDLTPFAGETIELSFTYWTDGYTQASGWYIDDIAIPEIGFFDDCETTDGWTVNAGWALNDEIIYNNFEVALIKTTTHYRKSGAVFNTWNYIDRMWLNDDTEKGKETLWMYKKHGHIETTAVMVVANQPGYEHTLGAGYTFSAHKWKPHRWWCW
ncbi:MAG: hypothetical protein ACFFCC_08000 [Promethearchaeota archaeon]